MADARIEELIAFLKIHLFFACCWPIRPTATRCKKTGEMIFRFLSVLHGMVMVVAILYTIYMNQSNLFLIMRLCCQLCTSLAVPLQIICFTIHYDRLQYVIYELEDYCKQARPEEIIIFHRYIDSCKSFYIGSVSAFTTTALLLCVSPAVESNMFPIDVEYPFSVDYLSVKILIYLHHLLLIYQSYTQVCSNVFVGLLLWYVSARCDILSAKFRTISEFTEFSELRAYISEHQQLMRYGKDVALSIRYLILTSTTISTIVIIFSGCTFLSRQPLSVKSTFLIFFISSLAKVYLCAWPADHLLSASTNIANAAYDSRWYNIKADFQKNFLHTLLRGQQPIIVNIPCMLPIVSLNYYASYVSTAFSYLTTFRLLLEEDGED